MFKPHKTLITLCMLLFLSVSNSEASGRVFHIPDTHMSINEEDSPNTSQDGNSAPLNDSLRKEVKKAHSLSDIVNKEQRYINKLDSSNLMEYPIGIISEGNDVNYAIIINKDEITPEGSLLSAYMSFKVPQSDDSLAFVAHNIHLNSDGGIQGDVKLELINTSTLKIGKDVNVKILGGEGKSYVLFGCGGFKSMSISADVEFSSNTFLVENPQTGDIIQGKPLKTNFTTIIDNWNNLLVELSLDPFQIAGIEGFGFEVKRLVLDFSDYSNPLGISFPEKYTTKYFADGNNAIWRGLYIQEAVVRLPKELKRQTKTKNSESTSERVSIGGYNFIIDHSGFSGKIEADNILTQEEGNMNGWPFTVESIMVGIETNSLTEAGFKGRFYIPVLDSALLYQATIGLDGNYLFKVTTTNKNSFNVWAADLELDPGSSIEISSIDDIFKPKAILNGKLTINASLSKETKENDKNKSISLADITFVNLQLQTDRPYIQSGTFALGSEKARQSMANFPVQITKLGATLNDETASLLIGVKLGVTPENESGIAVEGSASIIGERKLINNKTRWKYKTVELSKLTIDAAVGPVKIKGSLIFFKEDSTYGDGFQGEVEAVFGLNIKASAMALFGKVDGFRYWYADAMVGYPPGLPIFSGFGIYGFGGGAYCHMKQVGFTENTGSLGKSRSGITYKPDQSTYIGLKATVAIGTHPKNEPFNGEVGYEIAFNNKMGVRYMTFTGNGYFMTPPVPANMETLQKGAKIIGGGGNGAGNKETSTAKGAINASVYVNYDFESKVLHGNLKVYVNVGGIIRGVNENNLAGDAVMHFEEKEWYVYIGTPDKPVGITMMNLLKTQSYFMLGTKIPASPPPPEKVTNKLGSDKFANYMNDLNALGKCSGIAFGSRLSINTGDITFLMFYANMAAGIGFDVALKNYGNATCAGSSSPLGINGWYANGQAYAYMEGKMGVRVKIFTIEKKATILEGGVAAILQAKMPNPLWMQGALTGNFNVLNGLVKGNYKFDFTFGEECKIVNGSALSNIGVIAEVTPSQNSNGISVFNAPQAVFNYEINKSFQLVDLDNIKKTFRINLDEFSIKDGSSDITFKQEWNTDKTVLALKPNKILPGKKKLTIKVQVSFEQYKNGKWETVSDNGKKLTEVRESEFETGDEPDDIPLNNIAYSYPIINQLNYYKDESTSGYVVLKQGQDKVFTTPEGFKQKGRFTSIPSGKKYYFDFNYNFSTYEVSFTRPTGLPNDEIMKFELVNLPAAQASAIDANVDSVVTKVENTSQGNEVSVKTKDAEGEIADLKEKILLSVHFRTSKYNTLAQKLNESNNSTSGSWPILTGVQTLYLPIKVSETFDKFELKGIDEVNPLIRYEAELSTNKWYLDNMYKVVYKPYPITPLLTLTDEHGIPPFRAMSIYQLKDRQELTESNISAGKASLLKENICFVYDLPLAMDKHLTELNNKIVNNYWGKFTSPMLLVINTIPKILYPEVYKVKVSYYLPGKNIKSRPMDNTLNYKYLLD